MAGEATPGFHWTSIGDGGNSPGRRSRHGLAYDRGTGATILFGGIIWVGSGKLKSDTWEFQEGVWRRTRHWFPPQARHRTAMIPFDHREGVLLFGGQASNGDMLNDTWLYSHHHWKRMRTSVSPPPRCGHSMVYDEGSKSAVLFGGVDPNGRAMNDTWIFDGERWKRLRTPPPPARRYAAFAYHPDLKGCLLHGGAEDDAGMNTYGDAWLFRNYEWLRLPETFDTDPRDDHGMAYHRAARRMVMLQDAVGFGEFLTGTASGWESAEAQRSPPRHQCSPLAWDDSLGGLLIHGGEMHHAGPQFDTTWLLRADGTGS